MPLIAGTRLGPHESLAPLGAGGMGEVYRANDTRLDRDVAAKVLPRDVPAHYRGHLWSAMNAVGLGRIEEARDLVREARRLLPDLSIALVRRVLGAMAPEVDRRFVESLRRAGVEEG